MKSIILAFFSVITIAAQTTRDGFGMSWLCDDNYEELAAIPADGSKAFITFSLNGGQDNSDRHYTAYNLDIHVPFGISFTTSDDGTGNLLPDVGLPEDFSIYAMRLNQLSHGIAGSIINSRQLRVVCSSNANKELLSAKGDVFTFGLHVTSPYVKPGNNFMTLTGQNLTVRENAQKFVPADTVLPLYVEEGEMNVRVVIDASNQYTTLLLPFDCEVPEGITAYSCSSVADRKALLTQVQSLHAYEPYILYAPMGYSGSLSGWLSASAYEESVSNEGVCRSGLLCGAVCPQSISQGYVLQTGADGGMTFTPTGGDTYLVPEGKCWLAIEEEADSLTLALDDPTSIERIESCEKSKDNKVQYNYDLMGRRATTPLLKRNIIIFKGQKILK